MLRVPSARSWAAHVVLGAVAGFAAGGCGQDDGPSGPDPGSEDDVQLTAAWAGVWSIQTVSRDCGTAEILDDVTEVDTLCAGDDVSSFEDEAGAETHCGGTVDDTRIDVACTSAVVFQGLMFDAAFTFAATRDGDSFHGTGQLTLERGDFLFECVDVEMFGTRMAPPPAECGGTPFARPVRLRAESWREARPR